MIGKNVLSLGKHIVRACHDILADNMRKCDLGDSIVRWVYSWLNTSAQRVFCCPPVPDI